MVCPTPFLTNYSFFEISQSHTPSLLTNFLRMAFQLSNPVHLNSPSLVTFSLIGSCFPLKAPLSLDLETSPIMFLCRPHSLGAFPTRLVATLSLPWPRPSYPSPEESHYWSNNTLPLSENFNGLILSVYRYKYRQLRMASRFYTTYFETTLDLSPIILLYMPTHVTAGW